MTNDAEKAANAYAAATNEAQVQDYLARELRCFGWTVEVEPFCRTARGDIRRADLLCIGTTPDGVGTVVAVEIKHDLNGMHNKQIMEGAAQVNDYIGATAWTSGEGVTLPAPDTFALTNTWLLTGAEGVQQVTGNTLSIKDYEMVHERYLWSAGGCLMRRRGPRGEVVASRWTVEPSGRGGKLKRQNLQMTNWWGGR
jgi:hypothetical protein